jgi:hypothetical protein
MNFLSERISYSEVEKGNARIIISPDYEDSKQSFLATWVVFWTLGGLVMLSQVFGNYNRDEKLFLIIWLFFWLYFEYVGVYAWLWKKYGSEKITIKNDKVYYSKNLKWKKKPIVMQQEMITEINQLEISEKNLLHNLSNSYWNRGNDTCSFRYQGKTIRFGLKLSPVEAAKLVKLLKSKVK